MEAVSKSSSKHRVTSIDILRGAIMLIMAIDHVRDYFHLGHPEPTDLTTTTAFLFFTRWITHFCAPTFVFLSGISAYLAGTRRSRAQFSAFLVKRGLWLLVIEFVFINFAMTLDPAHHLVIFQVIWAIGGSMILLGVLVWAPLPIIGIIGAIIFLGHNLLDQFGSEPFSKTLYWKLLFSSNGFGNVSPVGHGRYLLVAYALLPWTSVMFIGYIFGQLYQKSVDAVKRRRMLLFSGLVLLGVFLILRCFNIYGDPAPWAMQKTTTLSVISFFNVSKYPPSLLYLCMTLGVAMIILSVTEKAQNKLTNIFIVFGSVPLFYYIMHWYLIRIINVITFFAQGFTIKQMLNSFEPPVAYGYTLAGVYLIWLIVIVLLYFPCRWYANFKRSHTYWWLSYL